MKISRKNDFDARFELEDDGFICADDKFLWSMLDHLQIGFDYYKRK